MVGCMLKKCPHNWCYSRKWQYLTVTSQWATRSISISWYMCFRYSFSSLWIYHDLSRSSPQKKHVPVRRTPPDATGPRWDRDSASIDPRYPGHGQSWQKKHREFISMFGKSAIVVRVVNPNDIQHSFQRKSWDLWTIRWALAFNGLRHFTQDPDAVFWARETAFHGVTVSPTEHCESWKICS